MQVTPYLFLGGQCEAALSFYQAALGAEIVAVHRFKDAPAGSGEPMGPPEGVMHATLKIGDSLLHASDGDGRPQAASGYSLSVSAKDSAEGQRLFRALAEGGKVTMPFQKQFWSEGYGMLTDRFGVPWMVNVEH